MGKARNFHKFDTLLSGKSVSFWYFLEIFLRFTSCTLAAFKKSCFVIRFQRFFIFDSVYISRSHSGSTMLKESCTARKRCGNVLEHTLFYTFYLMYVFPKQVLFRNRSFSFWEPSPQVVPANFLYSPGWSEWIWSDRPFASLASFARIPDWLALCASIEITKNPIDPNDFLVISWISWK